MFKNQIPEVSVEIKSQLIEVPDVIQECTGIMIMGHLIKSLLYTTDVSIIANHHADAILAVYPFTPQMVINDAILDCASVPVFVGVGGGSTRGQRSANIAMLSESHGAYGVVVNAPMKNADIQLIRSVVDIPIIATVLSKLDDIHGKIQAGAKILSISGASETIEIIQMIRKDYPEFPIIATGGSSDDSIRQTIQAGANAIIYTPPAQAEIFAAVMDAYRKEKNGN